MSWAWYARHLLLLLMLALSMTNCVAQNSKSIGQPPPPSLPANDYFPEKWEEFTFSGGDFKISFPGQPKESITVRDTEDGKLQAHLITYGSSSFILYSVVYVDHTHPLDDPGTVKRTLDAGRDKALANFTNSHLLSEAEISVDGYPGRLLQIEVTDRIIRLKTVLVRHRVYDMLVVTPKGHDNAVEERNGYERIAMSFLDSFKLLASTDPRKRR